MTLISRDSSLSYLMVNGFARSTQPLICLDYPPFSQRTIKLDFSILHFPLYKNFLFISKIKSKKIPWSSCRISEILWKQNKGYIKLVLFAISSSENIFLFSFKYWVVRQLRLKVGIFLYLQFAISLNTDLCSKQKILKSFIFPKKLNFSNVSNLFLFLCSFSFCTKH